MANRKQKGKDTVGPSEPCRKRSKLTGQVPRPPIVSQGQTIRYNTRWAKEARKKWYFKHNETNILRISSLTKQACKRNTPSCGDK